MLASHVILQQGGYPGPMGAVRAWKERLHLTEEIHVFPQAAPVAVPLVALDTAQFVLAAPPNVTRQSVAEKSLLDR